MKKAIAIIILGLLLSGCAPLEAPVYSGMSKANYCDAKNFGAVFAMCNQKHVYYSNGIEVFKKGNEFAIFTNVTIPTKCGFACYWGDGTYHGSVYGWEQAQRVINNLDQSANTGSSASTSSGLSSSSSEIKMASMVDDAKSTCEDLGFEEGTDRFVDCSFKLYTQSVELAAKNKQQIVVQGQSSGSNVMTIYDPVRDNNALIKRGQGLINGTCTLADLSTC